MSVLDDEVDQVQKLALDAAKHLQGIDAELAAIYIAARAYVVLDCDSDVFAALDVEATRIAQRLREGV